MPTESFILPFVVPAEDRKKTFGPNMETTAILALAQANRRKPKIIDVFPEKIMFVAKLHYPLWIVPWENRSLMIDGLQISSSRVPYVTLPEIEPFLDHMDRGKSDRTQFFNALNQHEHTFVDFSERQNIQFNGMITDKILLTEIAQYIEDIATANADASLENIVLLPPKLDIEAAGKTVSKFLDFCSSLQSDIKGLEYAFQILNQTAKLHQAKINREIELSNRVFNKEIEAITPGIEKNVAKLRMEQNAKTERLNKLAKTLQNAKMREKERLQREFQKLELKRTQSKRRLDIQNPRDKAGTARKEQSLRSCENRLLEAKERLEALSHEIERAKKQNLEEITSVQHQYQALIDGERRKIINIEVARESAVGAKKNEEDALRSVTARILGQIEQMAEQRKRHRTELEELAIAWQPKKATLVALPFYLIAYYTVDRHRYSIFSPFKAQSSEGIMKKIEKKLLSFSLTYRLQLLLQSRSKLLDKMLSTFLDTMQTDKALDGKLTELGEANNLLSQVNLREVLTKGAAELKAEGWIKQEEGVKLIKDYVKG